MPTYTLQHDTDSGADIIVDVSRITDPPVVTVAPGNPTLAQVILGLCNSMGPGPAPRMRNAVLQPFIDAIHNVGKPLFDHDAMGMQHLDDFRLMLAIAGNPYVAGDPKMRERLMSIAHKLNGLQLLAGKLQSTAQG